MASLEDSFHGASNRRSKSTTSLSEPRSNRSSVSMPDFRTVSLPGLLPSVHLGILASGYVDKLRDGAVRGGWAKRLFIVSTRGVHYFRKVEDGELFGRERGQSSLADIGFAKLVSPEDAPYGAVEAGAPSAFFAVLSKKKTLLMFLRTDTRDVALKWVNVINGAVQTATAFQFAPRWPAETVQNFIDSASTDFTTPMPETPVDPPKDAEPVRKKPPPPTILAVTMTSTVDFSKNTTSERLIQRKVSIGQELELGAFGSKDFCVFLLSDGEEIHVPLHQLGRDASQLVYSPKELDLTTPPRSDVVSPNIVTTSKVKAKFRCTRHSTLSRSPSFPPPTKSLEHKSDSSMQLAFPGALSGLFLVFCLLSLLFAPGVQGLTKLTLMLGIALSISQLLQTHQRDEEEAATSKTAVVSRPPGPSSSHNFYVCVESIEVVEVDQDMDPLPSPSSSDAVDAASDATPREDQEELKAISGGPMAFSGRFIAAEKGDEEKGRERFEATLQWRAENGIDDILIRPHPHFEAIKEYYPQYFHGRSKNGEPVYYEQPGKINLKALKSQGLTIDDLLRHYMYVTEYLWRVIEPSDTGRSITVLDVTGIGMSDLGGDVLDFIKRASKFTGDYYPERSAHIFIINIPGWFNMIWRVIKPMIDPVTREKVHMLRGSAILRELEMLISNDNIPSDLGGSGPPLGHSEEEERLYAHVRKYQDGHADAPSIHNSK